MHDQIGDEADQTLGEVGTANRRLNQAELARRLRISPRTLERWRWSGDGPSYLKIGARVVYRLEDIEAYEAKRLRPAGAKVSPAAPSTAPCSAQGSNR